MSIIFTRISDEKFHVRSPFSAKDVIKETVPWQCRTWNRTKKVWVVETEFEDLLREALELRGYSVRVVAKRPKEKAEQGSASNWIRQCFMACKPSHRTKLKRSLQAVFHPDAGGSEEISKQINSIADDIR